MADSKLADLTAITTPADADLLYVVADPAGTPVDRKVTVANLLGGAWTLVLNESGASITNWTAVGGTWSADAGGFIKQTNTGAAYYGLKYNSEVPVGAGIVAQAEIRFPAAATAGRRAMLGPSSSGLATSTNDPWGGIGENADQVWIHEGDQATASEAITVDEDVWYTVRVTLLGNIISVSVDGTMVKSTRFVPAALMTVADLFILINYTGEAHYRNIKVWRLDGPV